MSRRVSRHVAFEDDEHEPYSPAAFLYACDSNNKTLIAKYLKAGVDPNCHENDFVTGLHIAADRDYFRLGKMLLGQPGIRVNCRDEWGHTPLFQACVKDNERMVHLLIKYAADVNIPDKNGTSPLHYCVMLRHNHLANILLKNRAKPDCENIFGKTPLYIAVLDSPNEQNIRRLARHGADVNRNNGIVMPVLIEGALICHNGSMLNMLEYFIEFGCYVNIKDKLTGRTALHMVAISNYIPLAEVLMSFGADPIAKDFQKKTPLDLATAHNNEDMISFLKYAEKHVKN